MQKRKKIVTIGGGTGTFAVLSGLKKQPLDLTAIVAMSDDGGSTGRLRDEFGVLPPGDVRQSLVALSEDDSVMRRLFNYRYAKGDMAGHSFGNIFISTLEHITGNMDEALDVASEILKIRGHVVPVTLSKVRLVAQLKNGKRLEGEGQVDTYQLLSKFGIKRLYLKPKAVANPKALQAIREADIIIVGPGDLYTSLLPNFLVEGIGEAFARSKAKKVYIANLMNKLGHTDGFTISEYLGALEKAIGKRDAFDAVIYNTTKPPAALVRKYADEGEPVSEQFFTGQGGPRVIGVDLLAEGVAKTSKGDVLHRTLIRHDPEKIANAILAL